MVDKVLSQVDEAYIDLINHIRENGTDKSDRTGTGTRAVFGHTARFDLSKGFPLLSVKKTRLRSILEELLWMMDSVPQSYADRGFGPNNIKYLVDSNVNIWNEWPYKNYRKNAKYPYDLNSDNGPYSQSEYVSLIRTDEDFARRWGRLGPVYGYAWRYWDGQVGRVDQIEDVVKELKCNPDSRRLLVTAWNPQTIQDQLLPPCHYSFQFWTRKTGDANADGTEQRALSMLFNMRSVDVGLGWPFDVASYALNLMMVAHCVGMVPDQLVICSGDTHIYNNHRDALYELADRGKDHYKVDRLPRMSIATDAPRDMRSFRPEHFILSDYDAKDSVALPIAV